MADAFAGEADDFSDLLERVGSLVADPEPQSQDPLLTRVQKGAGYGRSVCPESSRLHARNNGMDNGMQLRKEKLNL